MAINYGQDGLGYGDYANALLAGQIFTYHCPAQAMLLTGTTGGFPTLINPLGSGRVFIPINVRISFVSGTTTIGSVLIADTLNVGANIATGAPILTATLVAGVSAVRGGGNSSVMKWSPTTNTFTAAPVVNSAAGLNLGAAAPTGTGTYELDLLGQLAYAPGTAMSIVYSVTTSTSLWQITLMGIEAPLTGGPGY